MGYANRFEQAVAGLTISEAGGVVLVVDSETRWLVPERIWGEARASMEAEESRNTYGDEGNEDGPDDEQMAYADLCHACAALVRRDDGQPGKALVSLGGESRGAEGARRELIGAAFAAELIAYAEAIRMGGGVQ